MQQAVRPSGSEQRFSAEVGPLDRLAVAGHQNAAAFVPFITQTYTMRYWIALINRVLRSPFLITPLAVGL
jgi:hypothetical protein